MNLEDVLSMTKLPLVGLTILTDIMREKLEDCGKLFLEYDAYDDFLEIISMIILIESVILYLEKIRSEIKEEVYKQYAN